ncbi:MAG: tetratricopeptide repeat protein [Planctomycetota bacterium]
MIVWSWMLSLLALTPLSVAEDGEDILCLKDGRIYEQLTLERVDGGVRAKFENGNVFVPSRLILESIVSGDTEFSPETEEEKEMVEKGLVLYEGEWMRPNKRDRLLSKRLEERKEAIEAMKEHSLWRNRYKENTSHFRWEYTIPEHIFESYRDLMEAYFVDFAKKWKIQTNAAPLVVCFYGDREAFHQIGGVGGGIIGYFRYVEPWELNIFYDRTDPELTQGVMFHEANHYLQKLIDVRFKYPHFPGESLAEYYGASTYDPKKKKFESGLIQEGRLIEIQTDIAGGEMMSLEKLVSTDRMYEHYTWGWALAHFLMSDRKHEKAFTNFFLGLAHDKALKDRVPHGAGLHTVEQDKVWEYFRAKMGLRDDDDVKELEEEWHGYIQEKLQLVSSAGYEKAAFAAASTYPARPIKAKRLFQEAIEKGSQNPLTFHRYAELLYDERESLDEALKLWDQAIALDPLNATFYAAKGKALARKGMKEEGKKLVALAKELDPEFFQIDLSSLFD